MEKKNTHNKTDSEELRHQSDLSNDKDTGHTFDAEKTSNDELDAHTPNTQQDDVDVMAQKSPTDNEVQDPPTPTQTTKPSRRRKPSTTQKNSKQGSGGTTPSLPTSNVDAPADAQSPNGEAATFKDTLLVDQTPTSSGEDKKSSES